jgi:hypothetical protein
MGLKTLVGNKRGAKTKMQFDRAEIVHFTLKNGKDSSKSIRANETPDLNRGSFWLYGKRVADLTDDELVIFGEDGQAKTKIARADLHPERPFWSEWSMQYS